MSFTEKIINSIHNILFETKHEQIEKPQLPQLSLEEPKEGETVLKIPLNDELTLDMFSFYHALISGRTGSGKGVFIQYCLAKAVANKENSPFDIIIIDKKGVDFKFLKTAGKAEIIPNIKVKDISKKDQVLIKLRELWEEKERRAEIIWDEDCLNIQHYNSENKDKYMKPIWVIIDEYAGFKSEYGDEADDIVSRLLAEARSYGIFVWIATQYALASIVSSDKRINCGMFASGKLETEQESSVVRIPTAHTIDVDGMLHIKLPKTDRKKPIKFVTPYMGSNTGQIEFLKKIIGL